MRLDYLTTAVQGINPVNDAADFCFTPLRTLFGGRTFQVVYTGQGQIDAIHLMAERVDTFATKALALLLLVTVVPLLIGVVCKALSLAYNEYAVIEEVINSHGKGTDAKQMWEPLGKGYAIDPKGLALVPAPIKLMKLDAHTRLERLVNVWDEVGKDRDDYRTIRDQLSYWITIQVPNEYQYIRIPYHQLGATKAQLQQELSSILQLFEEDKEVSNDVKVWAIVKLVEGALAPCTPTWVETTHDVYLDLFTGSFQDKVLRIVQKYKENLLMYLMQHVKQTVSWHAINPFRQQHGRELGLVMENVNKDDAARAYYPDEVLTKDEFLEAYRVDHLISFVQHELNHAKRTDRIVEFLIEALERSLGGDVSGRTQYIREQFLSPLSQEEFDGWLKDYPKKQAQYQAAVQDAATATPDNQEFARDMIKMFVLDARTELNTQGAIAILHALGVIQNG